MRLTIRVPVAYFGKFAAISCSGLLYHLPEPWRLAEQFATVAPGLFLSTHCSTEELADTCEHGYKGRRQSEGGADEVLSGTENGFSELRLSENDPNQANEPAVTLAAFP